MDCRPLVVMLLAACSSPAEVAERTGQRDPSAQSTASASAISSTAQGKKVAEDSDLFSFELSYPAAVARIPVLARRIEGDATKVKDEMTAEARSARADAQANGYPFNPHSYGEEWEVVADLPGYLSLSNAFHNYSGGAHGMYGLEGLVWDRAKGRALSSAELFLSPRHLGSAMGDALCTELGRARVEKGMEPAGGGSVFPECPGLDEATVLVGSSNGKTFDRITVWFGPYVAGSYAEGAYELDFPITAAMLEAVKPAYRAAFSKQS
ncbi:DUF4163 domain-containing protein [Tsuneonella sp. HG249]